MNNQIVEKKSIFKQSLVQSIISMVVIFGILAGFLYWQSVKNTVFVENSHLEAPLALISPTVPGMLNAIYVAEGQRLEANSQVALVGSETLYTKSAGIVENAPKILGTYFASGQTVVSIVADTQMKVIGSIEETKGLKDIAVGQSATFTVDAFPSKHYEGIVDQISAISEDTGVIFSISDKRPIKKFNVEIRFDTSKYPELKSGMSAKITVDTKA
jgi:multidrug resistance efflux pump